MYVAVRYGLKSINEILSIINFYKKLPSIGRNEFIKKNKCKKAHLLLDFKINLKE